MIEMYKLSGRLGNQMFRDAYIYSQFTDGVIPDIYLQDYKYFEKYIGLIKERYQEGIGFIPYVGIHVRRGDYVNNPFYVDLTKTDYYERAIKEFPDQKFLVFSDDPEFCKTLHWITSDFEVVTGGTELEDLNMMASCSKGNIIANSSFSWWAAFLNPNPAAKVIAPREWFSDKIERVGCPQSWLRI